MRWVAVLAFAGCYSPDSEAPCAISCATTSDCPGSFECVAGNACAEPGASCVVAPTDGPMLTDLAPDCAGLSNGLYPNKCFPAHSGAITLAANINTDDPGGCEPSEATDCFIVADKLTIDTLVNVSGTRRLVLWSATTISVTSTGTLDVSSYQSGKTGPNAGIHPSCMTSAAVEDNTQTTRIGNGGNGGTFASSGGVGGKGRRVDVMALMANAAPPQPQQPAFHGGCSGATGGKSINAGIGGGAVYLIARDSIDVRGTITASGAAGGGGFQDGTTAGGGGGAGSGGAIAFDAPTLVLDGATIVALGGGGGSGASTTLAGAAGIEATPAGVPGSGGTMTVGGNRGGNGGDINGSQGLSGGSVIGMLAGGGGGGGGGAGFVLRYGLQDSGGQASTVRPPIAQQ